MVKVLQCKGHHLVGILKVLFLTPFLIFLNLLIVVKILNSLSGYIIIIIIIIIYIIIIFTTTISNHRASYIELYNEEINDLLDNPKVEKKCDIREDPVKGIYITNLCDVVVETEKELSDLLDKGLSCRTVAATLMNSESSRSHSIFTIVIEMSTKDPLSGKDHIKAGKLNLVDLAGSEGASKT